MVGPINAMTPGLIKMEKNNGQRAEPCQIWEGAVGGTGSR